MDIKFSKEVLNLISELTGLAISLHLKDYIINSDNYLTDFCRYIQDLDPAICSASFLDEERHKVHMCRAGLWCKVFDLKDRNINEYDSNYLNVGHRRLENRDPISLEKLNKLLLEYGLSQSDKIRIMTSFEEVPIVKEEAFNNYIIYKLIKIGNILVEERQKVESAGKGLTNAELHSKITQDLFEKELELAEKEKKRVNDLNILAAKVAHEVQLPIQSMVGIAENLYNELTNNEQKMMAHNLLENLIKLSLMAEPLRNIDKPTLTHLKDLYSYTFTNVDYVEILNTAIDLFRRDAEEKGIIIRDMEIIGQPPNTVIGSEKHLRQVFFNVIHNALKYSLSGEKNPRYNSISIKCRNLKRYISIEISNYGIGILDKEIKSGLIFQQGYRGELAHDRVRIGSGLGLYISKHILDDHNGKIKIRSKKINAREKQDTYFNEIKILLPKDKEIILPKEKKVSLDGKQKNIVD